MNAEKMQKIFQRAQQYLNGPVVVIDSFNNYVSEDERKERLESYKENQMILQKSWEILTQKFANDREYFERGNPLNLFFIKSFELDEEEFLNKSNESETFKFSNGFSIFKERIEEMSSEQIEDLCARELSVFMASAEYLLDLIGYSIFNSLGEEIQNSTKSQKSSLYLDSFNASYKFCRSEKPTNISSCYNHVTYIVEKLRTNKVKWSISEIEEKLSLPNEIAEIVAFRKKVKQLINEILSNPKKYKIDSSSEENLYNEVSPEDLILIMNDQDERYLWEAAPHLMNEKKWEFTPKSLGVWQVIKTEWLKSKEALVAHKNTLTLKISDSEAKTIDYEEQRIFKRLHFFKLSLGVIVGTPSVFISA